MTAVSIWVPLVVALLGIGGVLLSQLMANKREEARSRDEGNREQRASMREDAARSYEYRREAYIDFVRDYHRHWNILAAEPWKPRPDPPEDWLQPLHDRLTEIDIFGTREAARLAREALNELDDYAFTSKGLSPHVLDQLNSEIRRDLSIPDRSDREQPPQLPSDPSV